MNKELVHVLIIIAVANIAGYETHKGRYGWAVTFGLLFFALLRY